MPQPASSAGGQVAGWGRLQPSQNVKSNGANVQTSELCCSRALSPKNCRSCTTPHRPVRHLIGSKI